MQSINENNISEVFSDDKPLVLKFYAEWCKPCQMFAPVMEQLSQNINTVKFFEVNIDKFPTLAHSMNVSSIPTTVLIHKRNEVARFGGIRGGKEVYEWFNSNLPDGWDAEKLS